MIRRLVDFCLFDSPPSPPRDGKAESVMAESDSTDVSAFERFHAAVIEIVEAERRVFEAGSRHYEDVPSGVWKLPVEIAEDEGLGDDHWLGGWKGTWEPPPEIQEKAAVERANARRVLEELRDECVVEANHLQTSASRIIDTSIISALDEVIDAIQSIEKGDGWFLFSSDYCCALRLHGDFEGLEFGEDGDSSLPNFVFDHYEKEKERRLQVVLGRLNAPVLRKLKALLKSESKHPSKTGAVMQIPSKPTSDIDAKEDGPFEPDGFRLNGIDVSGLADDWQKVLTFVWNRRTKSPKWSDVVTHLGIQGQMTDGGFAKLIYRINQKIKDRWPETLQTVRGKVVLRKPIRGANGSSRSTAKAPLAKKPAGNTTQKSTKKDVETPLSNRKTEARKK